MNILSIETSCDETAVSILEAPGDIREIPFTVRGDALMSQAHKHAEFGGVFPNLAKREHSKNLVPLLKTALTSAEYFGIQKNTLSKEQKKYLGVLLAREPELYDAFVTLIEEIEKPPIDHIAVTKGPGLEPALWVGINFAKALAYVWNIPIQPINHMEGHIAASLLEEETKLGCVSFPAIALLISGGHTELVLIKDWFDYEIIGRTRDDAVGEAFDKVARMLGLPYPGGPQIARLARIAREKNAPSKFLLPRPMLHTNDNDFSFSGLKTAVLYTLKKIETITEDEKTDIAREFENAVVDVLLKKTKRALTEHNAQTLIIGGGVSANTEIRNRFTEVLKREFPHITLFIPTQTLSTDNAIMIGVAALLRIQSQKGMPLDHEIYAQGNLQL